jgi:hypothetical protein
MLNWGLRGVFRVGVRTKRASGIGGRPFTARDWCGWKFASFHKGLSTQVRFFLVLLLSPHMCRLVLVYAVNMFLVLFIFLSSAVQK